MCMDHIVTHVKFFFIIDGDECDGEGNSGGGRVTVTMIEGNRRW